MVSVERIMAYGKLDSESELETMFKEKVPSFKWPERGVIELNDVYAVNYPYVLKSVSFN